MKIYSFAGWLVISVIAPSSIAFADCNVSVSQKWNVGGKARYVVEASSLGSDCKQAVAVLVVRSGGGEAKYVFSSAAQYIGTFGNLADAPVTNSTKMRAALKQWIGDAAASPGHNMSRYLEWKAGAEGPVATPAAEFPFTVNADIPRATYEDLRKQKAPVFCFVQGIESERCLVLGKDGSVAEVGIQSFPG